MEGLISLIASAKTKRERVGQRVEIAKITEGRRTEQCPYHFQVSIKEIVKDPQHNASESLFCVVRGPRCERIVHRGRRAVIIQAPRRRLAEDIIRHGDLLKRMRRIGVVWEFAGRQEDD